MRIKLDKTYVKYSAYTILTTTILYLLYVIISPKIVGDSVGLHPVFVILSIIIDSYFFGLVGMLIAVPVAGIIKLLLTRWIDFTKQIKET